MDRGVSSSLDGVGIEEAYIRHKVGPVMPCEVRHSSSPWGASRRAAGEGVGTRGCGERGSLSRIVSPHRYVSPPSGVQK